MGLVRISHCDIGDFSEQRVAQDVPGVESPSLLDRVELLLLTSDRWEIELMIAGQAVDDDGPLKTRPEVRDVMRLLSDEAQLILLFGGINDSHTK
jgi:hypothetical protein